MRSGWRRTKQFVKNKLFNGPSKIATESSRKTSDCDVTSYGYKKISDVSPDDIFLVGFPKSGNTWMQNLVAGLLFGMDTRFLTDKLTQLIVPNVHGHGYYKRLSDTTFFKTHFLPRPQYRRVIYLVRDGRDAMVSYYHMLAAVSEGAICMRDLVVEGRDLFPCKWHVHTSQWLSNPFDAQMLIVRYEDLHSDPIEQLKRVCKFAGLERDEDALERCVAGNSFPEMQSKEAEFGWDNTDWNPEKRFIRRGVVGSYKDEMPIELIKAFEEEAGQQLTANGYKVFACV